MNSGPRKPGATIAACLLASLAVCCAQREAEPHATILDPVEADREGKHLAAELISFKPAENVTNAALLKLREKGAKEREIPVRFEIAATSSNWVSVYETVLLDRPEGWVRLTIIHTAGKPNQYELIEWTKLDVISTNRLSGSQAMVPFAGSDFWLADLGLEFLHWPAQRLIRKELREGRSCDVLESSAGPGGRGYSRIVSWVDRESMGILHADAYDEHNALLKRFDPTEFKKINGQWQLEEMEIRNRQTGSRTRIEFNNQPRQTAQETQRN